MSFLTDISVVLEKIAELELENRDLMHVAESAREVATIAARHLEEEKAKRKATERELQELVAFIVGGGHT